MIPDSFQQDDPAGLETLQAFAKAERFNKWLYDAVAGYYKGEILEIGSGIGNISKLLLERGEPVTLSDVRINYCEILKRRFKDNTRLKGVFQVDLSLTDFSDKYQPLLASFDTIIALNVIEHIKNDKLAIQNCKSLLKKDGRLVILVPAFQSLYNSLDKELGHFKRYTRKSLSELLIKEEMEMVTKRYFNSPGIPGWWISGSVFKSKIISDTQLNIYDKLVPLFRIIDKTTLHLAGLSVIAVAKN
jgi:SAM-dependent methyltransferase